VLAGVAADISSGGSTGAEVDLENARSELDGANNSMSAELSCAKLVVRKRSIAPSKNAACFIAYLP
jgi:hypothetical protein